MELSNPAVVGQQVITPEWSLTVLNSIRGKEAETILQTNNTYYEALEAGMEHLLLQVNLRYLSQNELPVWIGYDKFYAVDESGSMIQTNLIYTPQDRVWISNTVFPGAEQEGWIALTIPQGNDPVIIAFDPDRYAQNASGQNLRFIKLE